MANTYTQLYVHFVFAVKFRKAQLSVAWDERLRLYITAIVQNNNHKMLAINNVDDHIHIFIGLNPKQSISDLMRLVKGDSSEWINNQNLCAEKFRWQEGYGAFSYAKSQLDTVVKYIANQQKHHQKETFKEEYVKILDAFDVDYDERYVFNDLIDG